VAQRAHDVFLAETSSQNTLPHMTQHRFTIILLAADITIC
jgi:hypothetical protein